MRAATLCRQHSTLNSSQPAAAGQPGARLDAAARRSPWQARPHGRAAEVRHPGPLRHLWQYTARGTRSSHVDQSTAMPATCYPGGPRARASASHPSGAPTALERHMSGSTCGCAQPLDIARIRKSLIGLLVGVCRGPLLEPASPGAAAVCTSAPSVDSPLVSALTPPREFSDLFLLQEITKSRVRGALGVAQRGPLGPAMWARPIFVQIQDLTPTVSQVLFFEVRSVSSGALPFSRQQGYLQMWGSSPGAFAVYRCGPSVNCLGPQAPRWVQGADGGRVYRSGRFADGRVPRRGKLLNIYLGPTQVPEPYPKTTWFRDGRAKRRQ